MSESKILVPLNDRTKIDEYINGGADEFYIGFYDEEWVNSFNDYLEINRMTGFKKAANQYTLNEVALIADEISSKGKDLFVTLNASHYNQKQYQLIEKYLKILSEHKISGVIVSTPELVLLAQKYNIMPVCSTICGIYNSTVARFYYDLGARRMILPRDLQLDEIENIIKNFPDVHFEVFLMESGCRFSDGNCLGFHREKGDLCSSLALAKKEIISFKNVNEEEAQRMIYNNQIYSKYFHTAGTCGQCAIWRFEQMKVGSYKIVGRSRPFNIILDDIQTTNNNLIIASQCDNEEEFLNKMQKPLNHEVKCKLGLNCYYQEAKFK